MKKLLAILFVVCSVTVSRSQIVTANVVLVNQSSSIIAPPDIITDRFNSQFPSTKAVWNTDGENFFAEFIDLGTRKASIIVYDKNGHVIRFEKEMDDISCPPRISNFHSENFPSEKYIVWRCEDNNGARSYYSKCNTTTIWFDENGNYRFKKSAQPTANSKSVNK